MSPRTTDGTAYHDGAGRLVQLGPALGAGGEGTVHAVCRDAHTCAKLYFPEKAREREAKLRAMVAAPPPWLLRRALAWPSELLYRDGPSTFAGFLMPARTGMLELYRVLVPDERMQVAGFLTARDLCHLAATIARILQRIHRAGQCVGDLKPQNILVDPCTGRVVWVDTDSFQITAPTGVTHGSAVVTPEYTAPELFADPARIRRTPASDDFALAVLIHQLLLGGAHPFDGELVAGHENGSVERVPGRIRRGLFAFRPGVTAIRPSPGALSVTLLHPELRALFVRGFSAGHADPRARPTAAEWQRALRVASGAMVRCRASAAHLYDGALSRCPWCDRREHTGIDLFLPGQEWQRAIARSTHPVRAPERVRKRWLERHTRARLHGDSLSKTEHTWLLKTGAALGLDRATVTSTLANAARPPFERLRRVVTRLLAYFAALRSATRRISVPRWRLPRGTLAVPRRRLVAVCGVVALVCLSAAVALSLPATAASSRAPAEPPSRLCAPPDPGPAPQKSQP